MEEDPSPSARGLLDKWLTDLRTRLDAVNTHEAMFEVVESRLPLLLVDVENHRLVELAALSKLIDYLHNELAYQRDLVDEVTRKVDQEKVERTAECNRLRLDFENQLRDEREQRDAELKKLIVRRSRTHSANGVIL